MQALSDKWRIFVTSLREYRDHWCRIPSSNQRKRLMLTFLQSTMPYQGSVTFKSDVIVE